MQRGKVSHRSTADNHTCVCGCVLETGTGPRPCPAALSVRPALDGHRRRATRRRAARRRKHERVESGGAGSAGVERATKGAQTGPLGPIIWAFSLGSSNDDGACSLEVVGGSLQACFLFMLLFFLLRIAYSCYLTTGTDKSAVSSLFVSINSSHSHC